MIIASDQKIKVHKTSGVTLTKKGGVQVPGGGGHSASNVYRYGLYGMAGVFFLLGPKYIHLHSIHSPLYGCE